MQNKHTEGVQTRSRSIAKLFVPIELFFEGSLLVKKRISQDYQSIFEKFTLRLTRNAL